MSAAGGSAPTTCEESAATSSVGAVPIAQHPTERGRSGPRHLSVCSTQKTWQSGCHSRGLSAAAVVVTAVLVGGFRVNLPCVMQVIQKAARVSTQMLQKCKEEHSQRVGVCTVAYASTVSPMITLQCTCCVSAPTWHVTGVMTAQNMGVRLLMEVLSHTKNGYRV